MRKVITGSGKNVRAYIEKMGDAVIALPEISLDIHEQANFMVDLPNEGKDIVTLSSWIISDSLFDNVFILNDDLSMKEPSFNTYGASNNKINMLLFKRQCTIGEKANIEMNLYRDNLETYSVRDIDLKFGESVEKLLLIKSIL